MLFMRVAIIITLYSLAVSEAENPTERYSTNMLARIVGGQHAAISEFPYIVSIREGRRFLCGGSLITPRCALTVAHCVEKFYPSQLIVRGGATFLFDEGINRQVQLFLLPTQYEEYTLNADVAILKLKRPFPLMGENIETIPIDYTKVSANDIITVAGWGETERNENIFLRGLQTADVTVISKQHCIDSYPHNEITENMFCASDFAGRDSCQGDSGGPAVRDGYQVGIISWGFRCGVYNFPGVYTSLNSSVVSNFIQNVISLHC